jgi:hypothetical protein
MKFNLVALLAIHMVGVFCAPAAPEDVAALEKRDVSFPHNKYWYNLTFYSKKNA